MKNYTIYKCDKPVDLKYKYIKLQEDHIVLQNKYSELQDKYIALQNILLNEKIINEKNDIDVSVEI